MWKFLAGVALGAVGMAIYQDINEDSGSGRPAGRIISSSRRHGEETEEIEEEEDNASTGEVPANA